MTILFALSLVCCPFLWSLARNMHNQFLLSVFAGSFPFVDEEKTFLSLDICSLVKADSSKKEWKHECNESNEAAEYKV